jgi:hypothetical protein
MRCYRVVEFAVVVILFLVGTVQGDNLIQNGNFDAGKDPWVFTGDAASAFQLTNPIQAPYPPGAIIYHAENGNPGCHLQQMTTHPVTVGEGYYFSFLATLGYDASDGVRGYSNLTAQFLYDNAGTPTPIPGASLALHLVSRQDWSSASAYELEFTPQAGQPYVGQNIGIEFINATTYAFPALDAISVTVGPPIVPEPSTLVLIGTGLISLLAYAWRKRR